MVNQTQIGKEKEYPDRFSLPDNFTSWETAVQSYEPLSYPDFDTIQEKLAAKSIEVAGPKTLNDLAKFSTTKAIEFYGKAIADIRHPLGRTGINGTGVFWKAGKSRTADIAILRNEPSAGLQLAMVFNRRKWRLPGGFIEPQDQDDLRQTAIREGNEETSIDISALANETETLIPEQVKPNSSRSVDLGYLTSQVETILLPDIEMSFDLAARDDAEAASWFDHSDVVNHHEIGQISPDHYAYAMQAFSHGRSRIAS
ncbi:NUDIX hydrolase [Candidatus Saccharibacteria bacterium]|nr:NUDIX hydrolase [Candidatus Saccharibacteria bacterium]